MKDNVNFETLFVNKVPWGKEHLYVELFTWENETKGTSGTKAAIQRVFEKSEDSVIRKDRVGLPQDKTVIRGLIKALQELEKELPDPEPETDE